MWYRIAIAVGTIGLMAVALPGHTQQDPEALRILKSVIETYRTCQSLHLEGSMVMEAQSPALRAGMQNRMETPTVLAISKPGRMRFEIRNPRMGILKVTDGWTTWVYMPGSQQYTRKVSSPVTGTAQAGDSPPELRMFLGVMDRLKSARLLGEETISVGGKGIRCHKVEVVNEPSTQYPGRETEPSPTTYWIDPERYLVLRMTAGARRKVPMYAGGPPMEYQESMVTAYTVASINEPIPDSLFVFSPPEGAREVENLETPGMTGQNLVGREASDFVLKDLGGRDIGLKSLRGGVVLLDFWASWCGPCRAELPSVEKLHLEFKDKGLTVLGINNESPETARDFLKKNAYTFTALVDTARTVAKLYQVQGIPTVVVIDRDGRISSHFVGTRSESDLRGALARAGIDSLKSR